MTCVHLECDRPARIRGLCERHYDSLRKRAKRLQAGMSGEQRLTLRQLCNAGLNQACVDCGDAPLFGGLRCLDCFQIRCDSRKGSDEHLFTAKVPSMTTYRDGCRCAECREISARYQRHYRSRVAA